MENEMNPIAETLERLEAATAAFAQALSSLDQRQQTLSGELERISASIEMSEREQELSKRLTEAEAELETLRAAASTSAAASTNAAASSLRRTLPPVTVELLAKQGIGEGSPVELSALDAALSGLPLEQRIAVKAQLMRAGTLS